MKLLSLQELKALARQQKKPCISIFMPTHRKEPGILQDRIQLRNLLGEVEERLIATNMRSESAKELLRPVAELDRADFWQKQSDGLAIFLAEDRFDWYQLPLSLEKLALVGDRFYLKPVLPLFNRDGRFYILALSQQQIRLFQGTRYNIHEIDLTPIVPTLAEVLRFEALERQVPSHMGTPGAASRQGVAAGVSTFHGHGAGAEDEKKNLCLYFHRVDRVLADILRRDRSPLVLAGVGYLLSIYREANTYPYLMLAGIAGNPESLSAVELRERAWTIVEPYFLQAQEDAIAQYKELADRKKASSDICEILPAAYQGRVDCLLLATDWQQWGKFEPETQAIDVHASAELDDEELLDAAAVQTLLHDGTVYAIEPENMPNGTKLAAVLRY